MDPLHAHPPRPPAPRTRPDKAEVSGSSPLRPTLCPRLASRFADPIPATTVRPDRPKRTVSRINRSHHVNRQANYDQVAGMSLGRLRLIGDRFVESPASLVRLTRQHDVAHGRRGRAR
jgi:hypothetical protein